MMRLAVPIMLAAMPTHSWACAASVSSRSCAVWASATVAGDEGSERNIRFVMMGLIMRRLRFL